MFWLDDDHAKARTALLLLLAGITCIALVGVSRLRFNSDPRFIVQSKEDADTALARMQDSFSSHDQQCFILLEGDNLLSMENVEILHRLHHDVQQLEGVEQVVSLLIVRGKRRVGRYLPPLVTTARLRRQPRELREEILAHPLISGHLLTANGRSTLLLVQFNERFHSVPEWSPVLRNLRRTIDEHLRGTQLQALLTGMPPIHKEIYRIMRRDQILFNVVGLTLASLLALALFQRFTAALLVGLAPSVGVIWTMGTMGFLGRQITIINSIVPLMILVIGYTDAVHLLLHIRHELSAGRAAGAACRSGVRQLWRPCALTSLTTALAFGSLVISKAGAVQEFGLICALGCALNFIAVLTILPLLAATRLSRNLSLPMSGALRRFDLWCRGLARFSQRYARAISLLGCLLTLAAAATCMGLQTDDRLQYNLPQNNAAYQAYQLVDERFGGVMLIEVLVELPQSANMPAAELLSMLRDIHRALARHDIVSHPLSLLNVVQSLADQPDDLDQGVRRLRHLPDALLRQFYLPEKGRLLVTAHVPDCGSGVLSLALGTMETQLASICERYPGVRIDLTGQTVVGTQLFNTLVRDLGYSLLLASLIIGLLMAVSFRSLRYGLISIVPNAFALLGVAALTVLTRGSFQYISVLVLTICLGIAVDDTIHLLARYRSTGDMERSIRSVGLAMIVSSAVFLIGFGSVFLSGIPVLRVFSVMACASLLLALVADLVLLPALLHWLDNND